MATATALAKLETQKRVDKWSLNKLHVSIEASLKSAPTEKSAFQTKVAIAEFKESLSKFHTLSLGIIAEMELSGAYKKKKKKQ